MKTKSKLLLCSDIHCNIRHCESIVKQSQNVDIVICAGDLASVHRGLQNTVDALKEISVPIILVPGNNETYDDLKNACRYWENASILHGNGIEINGIKFFGIGGGIPVTPFGSWSYDFTEDEAEHLLQSCPYYGVLVSHSPPKGVVDVSGSGQNLGSVVIRDTILEKKPKLVVCGHIHESGGKIGKLGESEIVNAGPQGIIREINLND